MGFMVQLAKEHDELARAAVSAETGKEEVFLALSIAGTIVD